MRWPPRWGRAVTGFSCRQVHRVIVHRRQASSHIWNAFPCGSWLAGASSGIHSLNQRSTSFSTRISPIWNAFPCGSWLAGASSGIHSLNLRSTPFSTRISPIWNAFPCGSWLACDGARAGTHYLKRRSTPFSTRIFAEISSTEKCVELMCAIFSRRNRFSTSRTSNSHWA